MIKKHIFSAILLLGFVSAGTLFAKNNHDGKAPCPTRPVPCDAPPPPPHKISVKELQMLKTLFLMSDKELARMRELITRLERTPIEKRRKMADDLERMTSDNPDARQKFMETMQHRFEQRRQNLLERYYATLPEDRAKAEAEAFLKMSRREQFEYMNAVREKLGLPPPHPHGAKHKNKENRSEKPIQ